MESYASKNAEPAASTHIELASKMASDICSHTPDLQNEMLKRIIEIVRYHRTAMIEEAANRLAFLKQTYEEL